MRRGHGPRASRPGPADGEHVVGAAATSTRTPAPRASTPIWQALLRGAGRARPSAERAVSPGEAAPRGDALRPSDGLALQDPGLPARGPAPPAPPVHAARRPAAPPHDGHRTGGGGCPVAQPASAARPPLDGGLPATAPGGCSVSRAGAWARGAAGAVPPPPAPASPPRPRRAGARGPGPPRAAPATAGRQVSLKAFFQGRSSDLPRPAAAAPTPHTGTVGRRTQSPRSPGRGPVPPSPPSGACTLPAAAVAPAGGAARRGPGLAAPDPRHATPQEQAEARGPSAPSPGARPRRAGLGLRTPGPHPGGSGDLPEGGRPAKRARQAPLQPGGLRIRRASQTHPEEGQEVRRPAKQARYG